MTIPGHTSDPRLESLLEFERLISDTSAALFSAPPDNLDHAVERSLERVRKFFLADRCALLSVSSDQQIVNVRLASYGEGIPSVSPEINVGEFFPWSSHRLLVERLPIRISRMADLPPEAEVEVESWNQLQIRSALTLPIERAGSISHIIVLNSVKHECEWPDDFVTRLKVLGVLLDGALERQELFRRYHESEKRLDLAADFAGAGLWSVDTRTREVWGTERLRRIFGYQPDVDLNIEQFEAVIHPHDLDLVRSAMRGMKRGSDHLDLEYRVIHPDDGAERWLQTRGRPYFGPTGDLELIMGVSLDITKQKTIEKALRESENLLAKGAHLAGLAFYEVDFGEGTLYVDPAFQDLCGLPPGQDQGFGAIEFWKEGLHPEDRPRVLRLRQELHKGSNDQITLEYRFLHPVSGTKWIQHLAGVSTRDDAGRAISTFGVMREVTARRKSEDEIHQLSRMLINAQEDERALLARELHDDLTQRLAVLAIEVGRFETAVDDAVHSQMVRGIREELVRLSEDIHSLAYHLHPSVLTELGLVEALWTESDRRGRQGQVKVSLDLDPLPAGLGREEALCLFRVAQEALNNIVRHAGTSSAKITLRGLDGGLLLSVNDRGVGFDQKLKGAGKHLGLVGMRERVRLVNGTLDIASVPGQGTTISAWVPCVGGPS
jgi:PAS domain S-box-containing protein